ncbi:MAG: flippase-like domain-containing protein [Myxococcales bacterium]|nr:flippase-like domain-containing protein [Myxococcales bacterium]
MDSARAKSNNGAPRWVGRLLGSLLLAGAFAWVMRRGGIAVVPEASAFAHVRWWTVPVYLLSLVVVHWFRAWRWDYLLRPVARVSTAKIIATAWVGFFAIMVLPLRMGEVVRPVLIKRDGAVSGSAAMGTIAAERVLDGLFVALLLAATLMFVPRLPLDGVTFLHVSVARVVTLGYVTVAVFSGALVTLGVFLAARDWAESMTRRVVGLVSPALANRLARIVGGLADGLRSLPDPKLMGPFLLQTAVYWSVNALGMWLLGWGCGLAMTPGQGFAVMGVLAMGILMPAGPGLFGAFQLSVFLALRMYFDDATVHREGAAYVFIMYVSQLLFTTAAGLGSLWFGHIDPRDALDELNPGQSINPPPERSP